MNYPYKQIRCERCGRFIATENIAKHEFIPDTHFTFEENHYWCRDCIREEKYREKKNE